MSDTPAKAALLTVALFPLPNVVLFPRAVLPLHIFEERYKEMTADVIDADRQLAMALLRPGWEKLYYQRPPIDPVICIGEILTHEKLADGEYNFLLRGHTRARIVRELDGKPYRVAQVEPLVETPTLEIDLEDERRRLVNAFTAGGVSTLPVAEQFRKMLAGPIATADLADIVAFSFIDGHATKQQLLAETDVKRRVRHIIAAVERIGHPLDPSVN